jgi:hypothetical protein
MRFLYSSVILFSIFHSRISFAQHHNEDFEHFTHNYKHSTTLEKKIEPTNHKKTPKSKNVNALINNENYKTNNSSLKKSEILKSQPSNAQSASKNRDVNYKQQFARRNQAVKK